jgi:[acyl-carrier-protein] S-malonyltransferase
MGKYTFDMGDQIMSKTACLFSGQGSQYVGMMSDLVRDFDHAALRMKQACQIAGYPLDTICFEGPADILKETRYTQPALFVHEAILWDLVKDKLDYDAFAGHSLGEYSALYAAGVVSFEDAMRLVLLRGSLMFSAGNEKPGTMFAVIGMSDEQVISLCKELSTDGIIVPANFNSPGQIVLSGDAEYVRSKAPLFKEAGARMVTELQVSGAFHSPLMVSAAEELGKAIDAVTFNKPSMPVFPNVTATAVTDPLELKRLLLEQLTAPVLWAQSMVSMHDSGIKTFCEIGPGKVLQGLVKRTINDPELTIRGIDTSNDVHTLFGQGA